MELYYNTWGIRLRTSNGVFLFPFPFIFPNILLPKLATIYVRFVEFNGVNGGMVRDTGNWCRPLRPSERAERSHFAKQIF
jgi:hypothetical protein